MKLSTVLILGGAGVVVIYLATRSSSSSVASVAAAQKNSQLTGLAGLGALISGAIVGAGGTVTRPASVGTVSSGGSSSSSNASSSGITPQEVASLDATNVAAYDAQGSTDAPVYGIAGIDY